tara:strand:+ start:6502 stop:6780 length:279 start_codon:yes stop_codon:yes gene_type:complete
MIYFIDKNCKVNTVNMGEAKLVRVTDTDLWDKTVISFRFDSGKIIALKGDKATIDTVLSTLEPKHWTMMAMGICPRPIKEGFKELIGYSEEG